MKTKKAVRKAAKQPRPIPLKYFEAVDNGVKLLDMLVGRKEWLKRMDMSNFDIQDPNTCVAGNVWEENYEFASGYRRFTGILDELVGDGSGAKKFGFVADTDRGMQHLQDLWVHKIKNLKRAQARARRR